MAKSKIALGRGLGALLPDQAEAGEAEPVRSTLSDYQERARAVGRVSDIELDLVDPNPYQPRQAFDEGALEELAASIMQLGVIQPITVRSSGSGRYEIISGERRVRASKRADLKVIPAYVREANDEAMLEMALVENVQREQLNPIEVAVGYQRLIDECSLTQEEVADKVGKGRATVANFLRLLKLPAPVQDFLRNKKISVGHARALIPVDDEGKQRSLLAAIVEKGLSVRAVEDAVRAWHLEQEKADQVPPHEPVVVPPAPTRDQLVLDSFTDRLRGTLGTKVSIRPNTKEDGGRIEVAYYSDDDLVRLIELMGS